LIVPPVFTPAGTVEVAVVVAAADVAVVEVGELVVGLIVVEATTAVEVAVVVAALVVVVLLLLPQPVSTRNIARMRATGVNNFFKLFLLNMYIQQIIYQKHPIQANIDK